MIENIYKMHPLNLELAPVISTQSPLAPLFLEDDTSMARMHDPGTTARPLLQRFCSILVAGMIIESNRFWAALYSVEDCIGQQPDPAQWPTRLQKRESEVQASLAGAFEAAAPHWTDLKGVDGSFIEGLQRLNDAVQATWKPFTRLQACAQA